MSSFKELKKKKRMLDYQCRLKMADEIKTILDEGDWLKKSEIAVKVFGKTYVTDKEEKEIYDGITLLRSIAGGALLSCRNNRYGWATCKEDADSYFLSNVDNAFKKAKKNINRLPINYEYLGVKESPELIINQGLEKHGMICIEHKR